MQEGGGLGKDGGRGGPGGGIVYGGVRGGLGGEGLGGVGLGDGDVQPHEIFATGAKGGSGGRGGGRGGVGGPSQAQLLRMKISQKAKMTCMERLALKVNRNMRVILCTGQKEA